MNKPIVEIRNVSKAYRLGTIGATSLREEAARLWHRARHPESNGQGSAAKEFWALRDVTFDVQPGEVVGIIGRNGAGKSTLLKILSRITRSTSGHITLRGRVASLLEVGTGFHPDLTGRENVFLNGAILGMNKAEIRRKFDEIVAFAEVDEFIDTPVKRYSSGMYVRLAFAIAAHMEPEILVVDEVLAVGDAAFQQKCLGKMDQVAGREGRTVLFVSHNMGAVQSLCKRVVWLDGGRVMHEGPTRDSIGEYLKTMMALEAVPLSARTDRTGDGPARLTDVLVESTDLGPVIRPTSRLKITIRYKSTERLRRSRFLIGIYDYTNTGIYALNSESVTNVEPGLAEEGTVTAVTDPINLTPGPCYLNIALLTDDVTVDY
ncbi:MAG: lipopolysaccharide transport system ATP-binding protein, partial [Acidobacteriota bacterium]|nr:lipopolysaccharide transport system ATP-binding protein [Acidobacteriota bacterium]